MPLRSKKISGQIYFYLELNYRLLDKIRKFTKYIGDKKPTLKQLNIVKDNFRDEIIFKLAKKKYSVNYLPKDDVIKSLLFRDAFYKKYNSMTSHQKRKYEIDNTILFTLTTLTTEGVDVDLKDVREAYEKEKDFTLKEKISKNMIDAVNNIKEAHKLDENYILHLHKMAMSTFETKTPGKFRDKQVYIFVSNPATFSQSEIAYRPPVTAEVSKQVTEFVKWYNETDLNPIEKATLCHYKFYRIHPFLDGNKRICRLLFNKVLLESGFPLLNISLDTRMYFTNLIKSVERNKPKFFVEFSLEAYFKQIKSFLNFK